jgi:hypothetical protein
MYVCSGRWLAGLFLDLGMIVAWELPHVKEHYGHLQWALKPPVLEGHGSLMLGVCGNSEVLLPLTHETVYCGHRDC